MNKEDKELEQEEWEEAILTIIIEIETNNLVKALDIHIHIYYLKIIIIII
jgi:hypothetical protein